MNKYKKPLLIALVVLDVAITTFFLVLSIMILVKVVPAKTLNEAIANSDGLVKAILQMKPVVSFFVFVLPMFLVLAGNIIGLMLFVRKTTKKEPAKIEDLSEEQKEALRQELLKDLQGDKEEKKEQRNSRFFFNLNILSIQ